MPYDDAFFKQYGEYLREPQVREAHDWIFDIANIDRAFENVIDLGCGLKEFYHWGMRTSRYIPVDLFPELHPVFCCDYRTADLAALIERRGIDYPPTAFVSLFSSEITAPMYWNYELYWRLFKTIPSLQAGLVSGFYYASKKDQQPIKEAGGIVSYQTLENTEDVYSSEWLFSERRITLPVPSKMFGPDVYEVWKFFKRTRP